MANAAVHQWRCVRPRFAGRRSKLYGAGSSVQSDLTPSPDFASDCARKANVRALGTNACAHFLRKAKNVKKRPSDVRLGC
jgi:hypothetical protein